MHGKNIDKFFFVLVLLDLMFFPYIRVLSASLSMLLLPIWFLLRGYKIVNDRDLKLSIVAISICLISFFSSFVFYSDGFFHRDGSLGKPFDMALTSVVIIYMFLYYIFFKSVLFRQEIKIEFYLILYLFFILALAIVFYIDPAYYWKIRAMWTLSNNIVEFSEFGVDYRFTSTLGEPNNLAALAVSILSFIVLYKETNYFTSMILCVISIVIVFATMSTSGILFLSIAIFSFLIKDAFFTRKTRSMFSFKIIAMIIFSIVIIVTYFILQETTIGEMAVDRASTNSIDSRYGIWQRAFNLEKILTSVFWGDGGLVIINNRIVNPHSGHLHLIYSYGLVFYFIFMFVFFRPALSNPNISYLFFLPLFLIFTINVGIYELRFSGIMALLIAAFNVDRKRIIFS